MEKYQKLFHDVIELEKSFNRKEIDINGFNREIGKLVSELPVKRIALFVVDEAVKFFNDNKKDYLRHL